MQKPNTAFRDYFLRLYDPLKPLSNSLGVHYAIDRKKHFESAKTRAGR